MSGAETVTGVSSAAAPPLRVCLVAENAARTFGGEAILPFHYFRGLRTRGVDAYLCVHERCRDELLALFPDDHDRLLFVRDQPLQKLFYRLGKLLPHRVAEATFGLANQMLTQLAQREAIYPVIRREGSLVHQPIPVAPRFPSLMYGLGCPVVIGPLNGGMEYPEAFRDGESALSRAAIACGRALTDVVNAALPGKRRAAVVLVANERTRAALPSRLEGEVLPLPENAVDLTQWPVPEAIDALAPARFVFLGRLVDWKRLDVALEALGRTTEASLDVIGDGPMRAAWEAQTAQLGLGARVRFHGWLSQPDSARVLRGARALVLPSVYESGGAVVLEAMAVGLPVVATAWGGPTDYLDPSCGVLVSPTSREALVAGFASAMQRLAAAPEQATHLGAAGRARVLAHFDWDQKIDRMLDIYVTAVRHAADKQARGAP